MARSVSVPSDALLVAYAPADVEEQWEFDDLLENLFGGLKAKFPSLYSYDDWVGNEDHVYLKNGLVKIGLSEYNGLCSIWVVANDEDNPALAENWANSIKDKFNAVVVEAFGLRLNLEGRFSNGEAIFGAVPPAGNKGDLGLGYSSKEGWL